MAGVFTTGGVGWLAPLLCAAGAWAQVPTPDLAEVEPAVQRKVEAAAAAASGSPESAEAWGHYGVVLDAHRFTAEATRAYREAVRLDAEEMRWSYYLATLLEYEDPAEAVHWYRVATGLDPRYAPAHVRYAQTLEAVGEDEDALLQYRRAAELDPADPLPPLGLGRIALSKGQSAEAVRHLERAYRIDPGIQAVVASLARAYALAGERDLARQKAEEARGLPRALPHRDPLRAAVQDEAVDVESYLRRSRTYADVGNNERALREIETLLELDDQHAEGWFAAAGIYDRLGRPDDALRAARRAAELDESIVGVDAVVAGALFKLRRFEEAEQSALQVLERDPDDLHMLVVAAMTAGQRGAVEELVAHVDRAWEVRTKETAMGPVLAQLLSDLAATFADAGRYSEAADRMAQALTVAQESGAPPAAMREYRQQVQRYRAAVR
jgi:tetratricopeptide (TPR) repeat protein